MVTKEQWKASKYKDEYYNRQKRYFYFPSDVYYIFKNNAYQCRLISPVNWPSEYIPLLEEYADATIVTIAEPADGTKVGWWFEDNCTKLGWEVIQKIRNANSGQRMLW